MGEIPEPDELIPLAEERLEVGKRGVERGRVVVDYMRAISARAGLATRYDWDGDVVRASATEDGSSRPAPGLPRSVR